MSRSQSPASSGLSVWANVGGRVFYSSDNLECGWYGSRWFPILMTWFIISWCCCWLCSKRRHTWDKAASLSCWLDCPWVKLLLVWVPNTSSGWLGMERVHGRDIFHSGVLFCKTHEKNCVAQGKSCKGKKFKRPQDFSRKHKRFRTEKDCLAHILHATRKHTIHHSGCAYTLLTCYLG